MPEPVARPKRLNENHIGFLIIELGLLVNAACWYLVGRALRTVDNAIVPIED